jgi:hypothetical protein
MTALVEKHAVEVVVANGAKKEGSSKTAKDDNQHGCFHNFQAGLDYISIFIQEFLETKFYWQVFIYTFIILYLP